MERTSVGRFAPSTTGPAHPGTLLAALLGWLDARARGGRIVLRLEDLDPERCRPELALEMERSLAWLGLDWDERELQSESSQRHEAALDQLNRAGRLYPCSCSRADLREAGVRAPDGGFRYAGTCRERALPSGGWRESPEPLRVRLDDGAVEVLDESGEDLTLDPSTAFGDPVVRRRDGAIAYHLAGVVDDAALGVTRVVRGRDLASSTAIQIAIRTVLGVPIPEHRHHFLLLEPHAEKLTKLHGSVGIAELSVRYSGEKLCGELARMAGLADAPSAASGLRPEELVSGFEWSRVRHGDLVVRWTGESLVTAEPPRAPA